MIVNPHKGPWGWPVLDEPGECPAPGVWHAPAERVSALLGIDGEPLRVPFERPRMGFDLTPRLTTPREDE